MQVKLDVFKGLLPINCSTFVLKEVVSFFQGMFLSGNSSNVSGKLYYCLSHSKMSVVHHLAGLAFLLQLVSCPINNASLTSGQNLSSTHHQ